MGTIATIDTTNLQKKVVTKTGRAGRVVSEWVVGDIGVMVELAFDNQLWTECFWDSELTSHGIEGSH